MGTFINYVKLIGDSYLIAVIIVTINIITLRFRYLILMYPKIQYTILTQIRIYFELHMVK